MEKHSDTLQKMRCDEKQVDSVACVFCLIHSFVHQQTSTKRLLLSGVVLGAMV